MMKWKEKSKNKFTMSVYFGRKDKHFLKSKKRE